MAERTGIEWCDRTWSPWGGCQAVSPACDHCYAEALDKRFGKAGRWGPHGTREKRSEAYYQRPWKWNTEASRIGHHISVFPSMCDPFENHRSIKPEWRIRFWNIVRHTPSLRWLLLTKRPQNIPNMLPADWGDGWRNVWLGCTAENREEFDRRIPHLVSIPAAVRFVSYEPALSHLGDVDLTGIHWLIAGCESGPRARQTPDGAMRHIRDACAAQGVAFFLKQDMRDGRLVSLPKLDGVRHAALPQAPTP